jgi:hypothetical protein
MRFAALFQSFQTFKQFKSLKNALHLAFGIAANHFVKT